MKSILCGLAAVCVFLGITVQAQQSFTLEQAIQFGLENQNAIKLANLEVADAREQLLEFKSIGIPKISAGLDYNYFPQVPQFLIPERFLNPDAPDDAFALLPAGTRQGMMAKVQLTGTVVDPGWIVGLRAQELYRDMVSKKTEISKEQVKVNITKAYLVVLITNKNREILNQNIENLTRMLRETRAVYENGFAEKLDVDRFELSLNNLTAELEKLDRLTLFGVNMLKFQMGYPMEQEIALADNFEQLTAQMTVEEVQLDEPIDFDLRAEYPVINLGEQLAELNILRYKISYLPVINAFASHQQQLQRNKLFDENENSWFPTSVIGLSLHVPIFDGLDKNAKLHRAKILLDRTRVQKSDFERGVVLEVRNARTAVLNARKNVETTKNSLDLAQKIYNTTQIKFKEGVGSSLEVAQAEREMYAAQANYTNALYDLLSTKTDLDKALGR
jgi:outer membrane protein TolC